MPGVSKATSSKAKSAQADADAASPRTLRERYDDVRARVAQAAEKSGRRASDIMLVAVTKYASIEDIRELVSFGHEDLGENRVQQLVQRAALIEEFNARRAERGASATPVRWHMIGSLQRNKVKQTIEVARLIHSVDSLRLAEELQEHAEARATGGQRGSTRSQPAAGPVHGSPVDILIEVNVSGEASKHGVAPAAARHLVDMIDTMVALRPRGLMCMAPNTGSIDDARRTFTRCKEIFDEIRAIGSGGERFDILSMGMSGDYEVAIECGSNLVRVGSAIFGEPKEPIEDEDDKPGD
jgi:pyridoxal phosphate enzyme (YggS family)